MEADPLGDLISRVAYVGHYGDDLFIVNRARKSFGQKSEWNAQGRLRKVDQERLMRMARLGHWTPFAHPVITLAFKMPIFVAREWYRHTIGFVRDELSRRDVTTAPEIFVPRPDQWRAAPDPDQKHTRSGGPIGDRGKSVSLFVRSVASATELSDLYTQMIEEGVAPEQARILLPQGTYTEFDETVSLAGYARLCKLRIAPDVQKETRLYAEAAAAIIEPLFPYAWKALNQ